MFQSLNEFVPGRSLPDVALVESGLSSEALAEGKHVFFLHMNDVFLDESGKLSEELMPDLLHPNKKGYRIWAEAIEPTLIELLD